MKMVKQIALRLLKNNSSLLICLIFYFFSCKKEKEIVKDDFIVPYVISGRLLDSYTGIPIPNKRVCVNYRGMIKNGSTFDYIDFTSNAVLTNGQGFFRIATDEKNVALVTSCLWDYNYHAYGKDKISSTTDLGDIFLDPFFKLRLDFIKISPQVQNDSLKVSVDYLSESLFYNQSNFVDSVRLSLSPSLEGDSIQVKINWIYKTSSTIINYSDTIYCKKNQNNKFELKY